jgi:hypothetical protein
MERDKYRHYTQEQRLAFLKEFDASGQSMRKFCENIELSEWTHGARKRYQVPFPHFPQNSIAQGFLRAF